MIYLEVHGHGHYHVTDTGQIIRLDMPFQPSDSWVFLGVSSHHWHRHVTTPFAAILADPQRAVGGYVWDRDHGTTRRWGGGVRGMGKVIRCFKL